MNHSDDVLSIWLSKNSILLLNLQISMISNKQLITLKWKNYVPTNKRKTIIFIEKLYYIFNIRFLNVWVSRLFPHDPKIHNYVLISEKLFIRNQVPNKHIPGAPEKSNPRAYRNLTAKFVYSQAFSF